MSCRGNASDDPDEGEGGASEEFVRGGEGNNEVGEGALACAVRGEEGTNIDADKSNGNGNSNRKNSGGGDGNVNTKAWSWRYVNVEKKSLLVWIGEVDGC